jgi:hypothetical protein
VLTEPVGNQRGWTHRAAQVVAEFGNQPLEFFNARLDRVLHRLPPNAAGLRTGWVTAQE